MWLLENRLLFNITECILGGWNRQQKEKYNAGFRISISTITKTSESLHFHGY